MYAVLIRDNSPWTPGLPTNRCATSGARKIAASANNATWRMRVGRDMVPFRTNKIRERLNY